MLVTTKNFYFVLAYFSKNAYLSPAKLDMALSSSNLLTKFAHDFEQYQHSAWKKLVGIMGNQTSSPLSVNAVERRLEKIERGAEIVGSSENCELVKCNWCDALLHQDLKTARDFCSEYAIAIVTGTSMYIPLSFQLDMYAEFFDSFPDYCMTYEEIREVKPGVVKITKYRERGSHTGKAFSLGRYDPMPALGLCMEDEPHDVTLHIADGNVTRLIIHADHGQLVGPAGFYIRLGGKVSIEQ